jgi:DNA (cytosine-5)-methyltransferase 1
MFEEIGYNLSFQLLNVADYGVPQDRKRVFFIGYRKDLGMKFSLQEAA